MRGPIVKLLACLLAVSAVATSVAEGAQRTGARRARVSRPDADKAYALQDIMKDPKNHLEREVFFYCRFATTANLFKNINTRFNQTQHINFAVWPDKALLWDVEDRKQILPTLYIAKNDSETVEALRKLKKYELIAVTAYVQNVYAGYPWMLVTKIEAVELPTEQVSDMVIEHMQNGNEALRSEAGGAAARHFEQAIQFGLPPEFRAKAYEQLARSYLLDNRLDRAREYLRQAVELDRRDPILHLALADVAVRMGDAGEALAHCEFAREHSGRYPQVYGIMGEAYALNCDYVQAFSHLNTAASTPGITPREKAMVSVRRARIYVLSNRFADAARVYATISEPGEALAGEGWLHNEIGLFYERLYLETGDERYLDSAFSAYEEASRLSRMDPSVYYNMTETEFRRQRLQEEPNFAQLKELIERINQVEPDYAPTRILEGRVLFNEGKLEEAEYRYQTVASQISENPVALMALAEAYLDLGRYGDAAEAVERARCLQPWHPRVKALGEFIVNSATGVVAGGGSGSWAPPVKNNGGGNGKAPTQDARYNNRRPKQQQQRQDQLYARGAPRAPRAPQRTPAQMDLRAADGLAARRPAARSPEAPVETREYRREDRQRLAQSGDERRPARRDDDLYGAPSRTVRVRPGEGVRVSSRTVSRAEPDEDIQATAAPGKRQGDYPVTEVRLSGRQGSEKVRAGEPKPLNLGFKPGKASRQDIEEPAEREYVEEREVRREPSRASRRAVRDDYDEGYEDVREEYYVDEDRYVSRSEPPRYEEENYDRREVRRSSRKAAPSRERYDRYEDEERPAPRSSRRAAPRHSERYDDGYGYEESNGRYDDRYEENYDRDYEAEYDEDGYLRFGQAAGSTTAYASLIIPDDEEPVGQDQGGVRIPKAFSFAPDSSPVIIAGVKAPGKQKRDMPVRNANVYRTRGATRQPAEIIEKETVAPRGDNDTSVMAPSGSGAIHKTQVRLPSSTRGIGMASDYRPAQR